MRRSWWIAVVCLFGCGSRVIGEGNFADAAADTFVADTGGIDTSPPSLDSRPPNPPPDTRPPPPPATCAQSIAAFECMRAADKPGKTVCTDAMIDEFLSCFGSSGDEKKCAAARMKYPECNTCVLVDWLKVSDVTGAASLDTAACIKKIDPISTCSIAVNCYGDCNDWVCGECDDTPGSGKTGSTSSSERLECERDARSPGTSTKPKGACYDVAYKEYVACSSDPKFTYCFVRTLEDLRYFYRGACRDGGSWSSVTIDKPAPVDAGTSG